MSRRRNPTRRLNWWIYASTIEQIRLMAAEEGYAKRPGRYLNEILLPAVIEHRRELVAPTATELSARLYQAPGWR